MTVIELFAGAGGAYLGLRAAGLQCVAAVELDPDAAAVLRAIGAPAVEADVRDLDLLRRVGAGVDGMWASFPCQPFSAAGRREGARDERNGWPWTVDAIDAVAPRWFVAENVGGLTHHRGGCDRMASGQLCLGIAAPPDPARCAGCYLERVILPDLRLRFAFVGWWVLDAADYGVPQHRERIIIWAGPSPLTRPRATHGPGLLPWVAMRDVLELQPGERVAKVSTAHGPGEPVAERAVEDITDRPSLTVPASQMGVGAGGSMFVAQRTDGVLSRPAPTMVAGHRDPIANAKTRRAVESALGERHVYYPPGCGRAATEPERLGQPAPPVTCQEVKGTRASRASGFGFHGGPDRASDAAFLATGRRRLTVAEVAALQGFPVGHPFRGTSEAMYRQAGNAVPPELARVVGLSVVAAWGRR